MTISPRRTELAARTLELFVTQANPAKPRRTTRPPVQRPRLPYVVLAWLYHARADWLARHGDGSLTVTVAGACQALGSRQADLRAALEYLEEHGLIQALKWSGTWFACRPLTPVGMRLEPDQPVVREPRLEGACQVPTDGAED